MTTMSVKRSTGDPREEPDEPIRDRQLSRTDRPAVRDALAHLVGAVAAADA